MGTEEHQSSSALPRGHGSKACLNCARIKCKCIPRVDGTSCERCHRLNKSCVPSAPAKQHGPRRHDGGSRSARLEEKLDGLVSLLRARHVASRSDRSNISGGDGDPEIEGLEFEDDDPSPPSTTVTSTAVSGGGDLGCDEPSPAEADESLRRFREEMIVRQTRLDITMSSSLTHGLAVLGAFVITSTVSHSFKAADGLRWSPYLDEYLAQLAHDSAVSQDSILIAQVKMQLIVNQVRYLPWKHDNVEIPPLYMDALRSQLENIASVVNKTSVAFEDSAILLGHYHFTMVVIHELAMVKPPTTPPNEPSLERHELYQRYLHSIKAWLDRFFLMPLEMYSSLPCSSYTQLFYVMVCQHKITTTIKDSAWDPAAAREVVDVFSTLDRIIHLLEQLKAVAALRARAAEDNGGEDQALSFGVRKFHTLKMAWQRELPSSTKCREDSDATQEADMVDGFQGLSPSLSNIDYFGFYLQPDILEDISWQ